MDTQTLSTHTTPAGIAKMYGLSRSGVYQAVASGRLPALRIPTKGEQPIYLIDPADAERLWGNRTNK